MSIPVEVKNIHYLLASIYAPNLKLKHLERKIPRGMNILLKITLHDNLGNEFSHNLEDINTLKHKLSRKEMADIHVGGNFTIGVRIIYYTPSPSLYYSIFILIYIFFMCAYLCMCVCLKIAKVLFVYSFHTHTHTPKKSSFFLIKFNLFR